MRKFIKTGEKTEVQDVGYNITLCDGCGVEVYKTPPSNECDPTEWITDGYALMAFDFGFGSGYDGGCYEPKHFCEVCSDKILKLFNIEMKEI